MGRVLLVRLRRMGQAVEDEALLVEIVSEPSLARCAVRMGLGVFLLLGKGELAWGGD